MFIRGVLLQVLRTNLLYWLGFFSGFSAILYQIVWMRSLGLILGSSAVSIGICLAAFMAGLGLGSLILGSLADRRKRPERLYAWLEAGIGLYGLLSFAILSAAETLFHTLHPLATSPATVMWIRGILGFGVLLTPTFLMGGTYPAAVRYLTADPDRRGRPLGLFYATNTIGAASAAFLFPLILLDWLGLSGVTYLAVGCNALACVGALFLPASSAAPTREVGTGPKPMPARVGKKTGGPGAGASPYYIGAAFFLSGFSALGLETLYNRVFILTYGSSIYSYSFILGVYLLGIGLGGRAFTFLERQSDARGIFFYSQLTVFVHLLISVPFLDRTALFQMNLYEILPGQFGAFHGANILVAAILCGVPAFGFGISYPAALKSLTERRPDLGTQTGFWSAVNGVGTALGSLLVTFLFLPWFGSHASFLVIVGLVGMSLILAAQAAPDTFRAAWGSALVVGALAVQIIGLPRWDTRYFHTQISARPNRALEMWRQGGFGEKSLNDLSVKFFREGTEGTVSVVEYLEEVPPAAGPGIPMGKWKLEKNLSLYVNGKVDASDHDADMVTQSMLGYLPMQFRPVGRKPAGDRAALVVGLGIGVTAAVLAKYPLDRLDVVEISPDVVSAARRYFEHVNENVLEDSRVRMFVEDGRHFLSTRRPPETYQWIVNEPSNAWLTGASSLFTREYFALLKTRLAPDGILCQWFQTYTMSWPNLVTLLATLHAEFPHIRIFNFSQAGFSGDLLILASLEPLKAGPELIRGLDPKMAASAHLGAIRSVNDLFRGYMMGGAELDRLGPAAVYHTDDRPRLELRGPRDLFVDSSKSNLFHFIEHAPELTFESESGEGTGAEPFGLQIRFDTNIRRPGPGGIRVVTFYEDSRSFLRRQSFRYVQWISSDGSKLEALSPLRGPSDPNSHRLTLSEFSKRPAQEAEEILTADGRRVTLMESRDTGVHRIYLGWNCQMSPQLARTFFARAEEKIPTGDRRFDRTRRDRAIGSFRCAAGRND